MSVEQIASCLLCQSTFSNHEELFVHSCEQIKVETNELEERIDKLKEELNNPKTLYGKDVLVEELQLLKKQLAGIEDVLYTSRQVE